MPNIMLTYRCNLRCPYCFANEFVDGSTDEISIDAFEEALDFLVRQGPIHLGLIGGEPTVHPQFAELLERAIRNQRVTYVTVYTNGIRLLEFEELLSHPKVSLLVNWNPASQIGAKAFGKIRDGVDRLIFEHGMQSRLNLGLNVDGKEFDYAYMLELLQRYGLHKVRISLTVPHFPEACGIDVLSYFKAFKPFLLKLFSDMDAIDVLPYYDCNKPPWCVWTPEEQAWLEDYAAKYVGAEKYGEIENTISHTESYCRPVVDVLPNLQAVRCFGMSFHEKANIRDFSNLEELVVHFMRTIDRPSFRIDADPKCNVCPSRRQWLCTQGCIGFKAAAIDREAALRAAAATRGESA